MSNNPGTDRELLTQKAYASDEKLRVRMQTHALYSVPGENLPKWVLDKVQWRGDERVLDVGMGAGLYFEETLRRIPEGQYIAADLSLGMAREAATQRAAEPIRILNADAQALPFPPGVFDVVMANHMLYHVPDIHAALAEAARLLKPEGVLISATNSAATMPEFENLRWQALSQLGVSAYGDEYVQSFAGGYSLEDAAALLHNYFFAVARHDLPGALIFPETQPILDYLNSTRDLVEPRLPRRAHWEDYLEIIEQRVRREITRYGFFVVTKLSGVLIATQRGDFAADYTARLNGQ